MISVRNLLYAIGAFAVAALALSAPSVAAVETEPINQWPAAAGVDFNVARYHNRVSQDLPLRLRVFDQVRAGGFGGASSDVKLEDGDGRIKPVEGDVTAFAIIDLGVSIEEFLETVPRLLFWNTPSPIDVRHQPKYRFADAGHLNTS